MSFNRFDDDLERVLNDENVATYIEHSGEKIYGLLGRVSSEEKAEKKEIRVFGYVFTTMESEVYGIGYGDKVKVGEIECEVVDIDSDANGGIRIQLKGFTKGQRVDEEVGKWKLR